VGIGADTVVTAHPSWIQERAHPLQFAAGLASDQDDETTLRIEASLQLAAGASTMHSSGFISIHKNSFSWRL
jgi:hypothetical protein